MKNAEILSHTDRTSWSRVAMVWRFYLPRIRTVLWAYPLLSLLLFAISAFGIRIFGFYGALPLTLLNYMVIFSPLALTLRHDGELTATLPTFGLEKCIVIFAYSFIIAPLLTWLPAQLAETISGINFDSNLPAYMKDFPIYKIVIRSGYIATVAQITVCLWVVCAARRPRLGILAPFAVSLYTSLVMGICGFIAGFTDSQQAPIDETTPLPDMADVLQNSLPIQFLTTAYALLAIFTIFAMWQTARAICHRQY